MAGLHFDITADNTNLTSKLQETERQVKNMSKAVEREGGSIENLFSRLSKAAAAFGAGFTAKELINQVIKVRGEFQQLEVAFTTMLGSEEKATALMSQLTATAAKTPFDLQGVANGARQLLAYGTAAEDVNGTLIRLGNIAAGLSIPLNDLVYLYGTTMTQGRLYTQDLNQFTGRGIPMIRELSKEFGVAESEIKAMVEAGQIGFPEVQKVINNLTNEGGMFFNLMEEQSKTITGQISNIGDSFSMMLNDIGKSSEGIINDALGGVSYLIENYESVGRTLLELVGTYGAYRTALMTITALQSLQSAGITALTAKEAIHYSWLVLTQKAQSALNKTMLANPYVAAAAAVAALGLGIYKLATYQTEAEKAQERLNEAILESEKASLSEQRELARLKGELSALKEGTDEYNAVKEKIISGYSKYYDGLEEEINQVGLTEQAYDKLTEAITRSFGARQYQQFKSQQEDWLNGIMSDNLGKLQERLYSELGDEQGAKVYSQIYRSILEQRELDDNLQAILDEIQDKGTLWADARIDGYIDNIREAQRVTEEVDKKARERFGVTDTGTTQQSSETPFSTEGKSISQLEEEIKKAEASLESFKKALADGSGTQEAVTQQEAYIKSLQDTVLEREKDLKVISEIEAQISKLKKEQKETVYGSEEYNSLQSRIDSLDAKLPQTKEERNAENKQVDDLRKLNEEMLELREKNQQSEIALMQDGTEKKLKQIEADYEAQCNAIAKQGRDWAQENKKAGVTDVNANGLTADQQSSIDEANSLNAENRIKQTEEVYKSEAAAMRTYLQEYGTFQQRKLAIAQEYADKIAKAQTEGDRLSLEKERDRKLSGMEAEALRMSIDWPSVFGEFGGMFDDIMQPTLEKVKQYMQTDDFKNLQPTDQSEITEAVNRLEQSLGGAGRVSFKQLGKEVDQLRQSMLDLNDAKQQEAEALERLAEAQEAYEDALNNGTEEEKAAADLRLTSAQDEADSASENVRKAEEVAQQNQQSTTKTATSLRANMENVTQGLQKLASGGIQAAYEGLLQLAKGGGENNKMTEIANKLEDVFIIGWIVQIIDVFKDGLSNLVGGLLDGIFNAVSGILSDVLSGDLFVTIGSSIMKGVGNIFEALTFGGFSHWGNNVAETKETIERLTTRNEALIDSIDRLNETMKEARGSETVKATEKAIELQQKVNENYRDIAAARAHYQGKHHSWSKYFNDWLDGVMGNPNFNTGHNDWEVYQRMNEIAGFQIKSRTDFLSITPEQMAEMLADADIKQLLVDIGEGGYGAKMVATLEDFADQAGKIEELREQMYESLTQISFDSMYDSFIDTLMDMDASAEDFADNFSEYMMKALLANKVGEMMYDDLESWYEKFGESMKDGELTADEMASLREDWDKLVEEGLALRDNIAAATGYDQTGSAQQQQASAGYSIAASQESIDMTYGRLTAMYEVGLRIYDSIVDIQNITVIASQSNSILTEIRNIAVSSNGYLEDIAGFQKKIWEKINIRLDDINNQISSKL